YKSNVDIELKQSTAYFNRSRLLSYIQAKARVSIDAKNVRALDRESRQSQRRTLINQSEIRTYLSCFTDPVYRALFKFALGTAMRPMDLCKYPYGGNGKNVHIMPYSEMDQDPKTFEYTVYASKGNKTRTIILQSDDLKELNEGYIKPFYEERRKKYK
ncbi:site-specific integrase, partial [Pseudomonas shirazensis]